MAITIGQRVLCPPYGIDTVARTLGALIANKPTPCFAVTIEIAGLTIERTDEAHFSLGEVAPGFEAIVPMDASPRVLRELATTEMARAALDRLHPADSTSFKNASFPERLHQIDHALRSGSLDRCADLLCKTLAGLLAGPAGGMAHSFGERKAVHALERLVVGEIAVALDEAPDRLLEQVRARFTPNA